MRNRIRAGGAAFCLLALLVTTARAENDAIKEATERGVAFLKGQRLGGDAEIGATALVGLTLLECGVPADDPAVEMAAGVIRQGSIPCTHTYSLSLAIMFLDRMGDANDEQLIQSMAIRLLAGQNDQGGWTYHCPRLDENEQRRLSSLKPQRNELVGRSQLPKGGRPEAKNNQELPKEIKDQLARLNNRVALGGGGRHPADNSNTQFATLGLWVARRHGIPAERALARVAARFRMSQAADGSWHYTSATAPGPVGSGTPSMTCAGLLALAVAHGTAAQAVLRTDRRINVNDPPANPSKPATSLGKDFAVRSGLLYLASRIGHANFPTAKKRGKAGGAPPDYYFFWSLERVGMIYGLNTIGKKDWYAWGSQILLDHQNDNGSWAGKYGAGVDTCFALLFLQRANVARDLTAALSGKVQDPGDVQLRAGGVGGEALVTQGPKPAAARTTKPGDEPPAKVGPPAPAAKTTQPVPPREETTRANATAELAEGGEKRPGPVPVPDEVKPEPAKALSAAESAEEKEAAQLATQLVQAPHDKQEALVEKLKERKGVAYTQALADAIPKLKGPNKIKARDALAERLTRMTAATLREKLRDESTEIRRAAALACAMKEEKAFVPDLIALLEDAQRPVAFAAHAALKELTGKNFGPAPDAGLVDRLSAIARWREWWKNHGGK